MLIYDIGDTVRLSAITSDSAGTASDPTTVTCSVRDPVGNVTALSVTRDSTGHYHADVSPTVSGEWDYRWLGTGALTVAEEGSFYIRVRKV